MLFPVQILPFITNNNESINISVITLQTVSLALRECPMCYCLVFF